MKKQDMAVASAAQVAMLRPETPATVTPMHMLQAAMDRGADLDKLQQLMDLQQRWEASEARKAFVAAMTVFKANPPDIIKTKLVSYGSTSYKHATLADVCAAAIQGLAQVGISHRWDVEQADKITVTCVLTHELGHSERVSMSAPADTSGQKNPIQAIASAVSYLQRYTLLSITGLAARDQDDDGATTGEGVETITEQQAADLTALAEEVGLNIDKLLAWLKVERVEDLAAVHYQKAIAALESRRTK